MKGESNHQASLAARVWLRVYTLLWWLALPYLALKLARRTRKAGLRGNGWWQRLGFVHLPRKGSSRLWVHAVSVGEVQAAVPLVQALRARHPGQDIVLTTTTATGAAQARRQLGDSVLHCHLPFDLPGAVQRFLLRVQPDLLLILETELWPNLLAACRARGVPVALVNARLSERSLARYRRVPTLAAAMLANLEALVAQGPQDAARLVALGAAPAKVTVSGNLKFDFAIAPAVREQGQVLRGRFGTRPVWVAASTHAGEEAQVLAAHAALRRQLPETLLLLVPRRPERFDEVHALCLAQGFEVERRSAGLTAPCTADVFLGDSMGELLAFYAAADVAFVGGSLVPHGGHNVLEPALLAVPVVCGPHVFNFAEITGELSAVDGLRRVMSAAELASAVQALLSDPAARAAQARQAGAVVDAHRGATARTLQALAPRLPAA